MKVILSEAQIKKLFSKRLLNEEEENPLPSTSIATPEYDPANRIAQATDRINSYLNTIGGSSYAGGNNGDNEEGPEDPMPNGPMAYAYEKRAEYNASIGATPSGDYASVPAVQGIEVHPISKHMKKRKKPIKYLVIHYTAGGNSKPGAAKSLQNVFNGSRAASADFAVDDGTKVQLNPDPNKYYCYAVGDGGGTHNGDSISIEMCSNIRQGTSTRAANHNGWYFTDATLSNARSLARELMQKYNIPLSNVKRHFDMTGKLCPGVPGWNTGPLFTTDGKQTNQRNNDSEWQKFKASLG
jgi:hypothetical protein